MKRIGVFLNCIPYAGGAFQYMQSVLEALSRFDGDVFEVVAIYRTPIWEEYLSKYCFAQFYSRMDYYSIRHEIDSLKCDLIIYPSQDCYFDLLLSTPKIMTIHDLMHRYEKHFPEVSEGIDYERREMVLKSICDYAAGILVDSEIGKRHVMESYGDIFKDKIFILPFTPPRYLYKNTDQKTEEIAFRSLGLSEKYMFYPAQFWQHKNHENLILSLHKLREKNIYVHLVLVGSPKNNYDYIIHLIHELKLEKQVKLLGYVSDMEMRLLYKNARAMVMPTFFGPTNIPPTEAFLLGCPVAISNIYAMPEQVGDAALLFNPNSIDEIADAVGRLWQDDDLCKDLVQAGYEQIKKISMDVFACKLEDIVNKVLEQECKKRENIVEIINFCRRYKSVYCYGAGKYGYWIRLILSSYGIRPEAFLVSVRTKNKQTYLGLSVNELKDTNLKSDSGVILSMEERHHAEITETLKARGITHIFAIRNEHIREIYLFLTTIQGQMYAKMLEKEVALKQKWSQDNE